MSDNPSAFPVSDIGVHGQFGMTLRDFFASKAIAHGIEWCERNETGDYTDAAEIAYQVADAMLAVRAAEDTRAAQIDALQAFKAYVHERLDAAGIPTHPDGKHSAAGCRVGDRLDIALAARTGDV